MALLPSDLLLLGKLILVLEKDKEDHVATDPDQLFLETIMWSHVSCNEFYLTSTSFLVWL